MTPRKFHQNKERVCVATRAATDKMPKEPKGPKARAQAPTKLNPRRATEVAQKTLDAKAVKNKKDIEENKALATRAEAAKEKAAKPVADRSRATW